MLGHNLISNKTRIYESMVNRMDIFDWLKRTISEFRLDLEFNYNQFDWMENSRYAF